METGTGKTAFIWDLPVRICHWLLAILVFTSWYTVEIDFNIDIHMLSGYTILSLVLFRIIWGLTGTRYARFTTFLYSPTLILAYAKSVFSKAKQCYPGHNPLGGISAILMIGLLLLQAITGLFVYEEDDYIWGPLSGKVSGPVAETLTNIHYLNFNILIAFIGLHIAAVLFYQIFRKEKLVKAMFTGKKEGSPEAWEEIQHSRLALAITVLATTSVAVYLIVNHL